MRRAPTGRRAELVANRPDAAWALLNRLRHPFDPLLRELVTFAEPALADVPGPGYHTIEVLVFEIALDDVAEQFLRPRTAARNFAHDVENGDSGSDLTPTLHRRSTQRKGTR